MNKNRGNESMRLKLRNILNFKIIWMEIYLIVSVRKGKENIVRFGKFK